MVLEKVTSSSIDSIGYDPASQMLFIRFAAGTIYGYEQVPVEVYDNLLNSASKGIFFSQNIRGRYNYNKLPT